MKTLSKYLKNRKKSTLSILNNPRRKYTSGTFHKLRVEIKKLDALYDLINFCKNNFKRKEDFKQFKLIFRQAGKIRELQLQEVILKKYFNPNSLLNYKHYIKELRLKKQDVFFSIINEYYISKLENKFAKIPKLLSSISKRKAIKYIENKRKLIKKLIIKKNLKANELHELRKQIKMINYLKNALPSVIFDKPLSNQDVLPKILGKWHDERVMIDKLDKAIKSGTLKHGEINKINKVKTKIYMDSEVLLRRIKLAITESEFFRK